MNWIKRKDQLPTGNRQVLTFSPIYTEENDPGGRGPYRVMNAQYVRTASDISHWACISTPDCSQTKDIEDIRVNVTAKEIQDRGL